MSGTRSTITFTNLDTGDNIIIRTNGGVKPAEEKGKKRLASAKDFFSPNPKKPRCTIIDLTEEKSPRVFVHGRNEIIDLDYIEEPKLSPKTKRTPKKMLTKATMSVDLSDPSTNSTEVQKKKAALPKRTRKYPKRKTAEEKRKKKEDLDFAKNLQHQFDSESANFDRRYYREFNNDDDDDDLPPYETLLELKPHVPIGSTRAKFAADGLITASWTNNMENKSCPICIEDFENLESVKVTDCFHVYHYPCIKEWFKVSKKCPVCKHECENSLQ